MQLLKVFGIFGVPCVPEQHGEFKNVLYVPSLAANLLSVYHMTHKFSPNRVTFDLDSVEITEKSTGNPVEKRIANHSTKAYEFSHFLRVSPPTALLSHANNTSKIWPSQFQIAEAAPQ